MDFCFDVKGNSPRVSNHNVLVGGGGGYSSTFVSKNMIKKCMICMKKYDCEKKFSNL